MVQTYIIDLVDTTAWNTARISFSQIENILKSKQNRAFDTMLHRAKYLFRAIPCIFIT